MTSACLSPPSPFFPLRDQAYTATLAPTRRRRNSRVFQSLRMAVTSMKLYSNPSTKCFVDFRRRRGRKVRLARLTWLTVAGGRLPEARAQALEMALDCSGNQPPSTGYRQPATINRLRVTISLFTDELDTNADHGRVRWGRSSG